MKKKRQAEIVSIIRENEIENQEMLIAALRERGFEVTQATVSRDINELGIEKTLSESGSNCYTLRTQARSVRFESLFSQAVTGIDYALNMVVIKCHAGLADAVCTTLDNMSFPSVLGTIAGDDTIFVAVRSEKAAEELCRKLSKL